MDDRCRLKVVGCGASLELDFAPSTAVEDVVAHVARHLDVGPQHLKLVFRGKVVGGGTLDSAGVRDRTKLMCLHTELYHREKDALAAMADVRRRAAAVDGSSAAAEELRTQLLCGLDAVDVSTSDWLRAERKALIAQIMAPPPR
mmetsp:Transcript_548/g.1456  ORF Transcript_548/g.1456 Transcript_548/m.1456 type:complete len:144 (+) Transcript_548:26-457(+)